MWAEIDRLRRIKAAAQNLMAQKGRHNTEIAYQRLVESLTPNGEATGAIRWNDGGELVDKKELELVRAAAVLIANGEAGMARPTFRQAETMARGIVAMADEVSTLRDALQKIADPNSFVHGGSAAELCRIYEDIAQAALSSNVKVTGCPPGAAKQGDER